MTRESVGRGGVVTLEALLLIALVAVAVLGVVRPLVGPAALGLGTGDVFGAYPTVQAAVDTDAVQVRTDPELPALVGEYAPGTAVDAVVSYDMTVIAYSPDVRQAVGLVGAEVLSGLVTCAVLWALLLLVRSVRHGDPFVPQNARRVFAIAVAVGLGGQGAVLLHAWGRASVIQDGVLAPYLEHDLRISLVPLVVGAGIAVAAEVFRQGAELRDDARGLV